MLLILTSNNDDTRYKDFLSNFPELLVINKWTCIDSLPFDQNMPYNIEEHIKQRLDYSLNSDYKDKVLEDAKNIFDYKNTDQISSNSILNTVNTLNKHKVIFFPFRSFKYSTDYIPSYNILFENFKKIYKDNFKVIFFCDNEQYLLSSFMDSKRLHEPHHASITISLAEEASVVEVLKFKKTVEQDTALMKQILNRNNVPHLCLDNFFYNYSQASLLQFTRFLKIKPQFNLLSLLHQTRQYSDPGRLPNYDFIIDSLTKTDISSTLR
jgi:hypothetical protein